ncbi:hypothetical protein B0H17DRAFT_1142888 [Mycena rosella]|uniref:Uncharacterized protein n=1 Tax=Mycena rosella TaxID=1033263 RepID=A0AAD7G8W6_MYCRO|nr:hypothetical protein B0H17DRAFT_1142888 [Mycena rosella]
MASVFDLIQASLQHMVNKMSYELFKQQYRIPQSTVTVKKGSSVTGISLPTKQNSRIRIQYRKPNRPTDQINRIKFGRHTRITEAEQAEHTEKPESHKVLRRAPIEKVAPNKPLKITISLNS